MTQQKVVVSDADPGLNMAISASISDSSSLSTPSSWPSSSENSKMTRGARHCLVVPLSSSETVSKEGTVSSSSSTGSEMAATTHHPQPPDEAETTWMSFLLDMMKIIHELDMGKQLLGLAILMGVALAVSASSIVQTIQMHAVTISLSFAVAAICISLLLHKIYPRISTSMLLFGYALMMLSFYSLLASHLPLHLKWIPLLCWLASVIVPFAMVARAYFRTGDKTKDPEKGG